MGSQATGHGHRVANTCRPTGADASRLRIQIAAVSLLVCAGAVTSAVGQQQVGGLRVAVSDQTGGVIPGADAELGSPALIRPDSATTNRQGLAIFNNLPPGKYGVTVHAAGFQTAVSEDIDVQIGRTLTVEIALEVGAVDTEVVVVSGATGIDTYRSESASVFSGSLLTDAAGGRDFADYAHFAPSVNIEAQSGRVSHRGRPVTGISVDGSSGAENVFYVDGVDTTSIYNGLNNQNLRVETVAEVQLKTAGYEAEFGGAMGGVLSVQTKSGSNTVHGSALWYGSGSALSGAPSRRLRLDPQQAEDRAEYVFDPEDSDVTNEYGFTLGGPVLPRRAWFYGAFLPQYRTRTRSVTFTSGEAGDFRRRERLFSSTAKIDIQPANNLRLMASLASDWADRKGGLPSLDGTDNPAFNWPGTGFSYPGYTLTGAATFTPTPNFALDARWGLNAFQVEQLLKPDQVRHLFVESPGRIGFAPDDPLYRPRRFATVSHAASFATEQDFQKKGSLALTGSYLASGPGQQHSLRFGWQHSRLANDVNDSYTYDYVLYRYARPYNTVAGASLTSSCTGPDGSMYDPCGYIEVRSPFGIIADASTNRDAIFVQDAWTVGRRLTLNLGLRLEKEEIPSFSKLPGYTEPPIQWGFTDKVAPRLGVAYDVLGNAKLKAFASWGRFYDAMKLTVANGLLGGFQWLSHYYLMDDSALDWTGIGGLSGRGPYPGSFVETRNWRLPAFEDLDPDLRPMRMSSTVAGLELEPGRDYVLSFRYTRKNLDEAIEDVGRQTPEGEAYYITNPGRGVSVSEFLNAGLPATPKPKRTYNAWELRLRKAFRNRWQADVSYVYCRLRGLYSGLGSSDEDGRITPNADRDFDLWFLSYDSNGNLIDGPLGTDRPHQIKSTWAYVTPWGMQIAGFFRAASGTPISRTVDLEHVHVMVENRGSDGRNPTWTQTDLSFVQRFHLFGNDAKWFEINLNVLNVFNQRTALRTYRRLYRQSLPLWQPGDPASQVLGGYDYEAIAASEGARRDPRFRMPDRFLDPIEARFGLRFVF